MLATRKCVYNVNDGMYELAEIIIVANCFVTFNQHKFLYKNTMLTCQEDVLWLIQFTLLPD